MKNKTSIKHKSHNPAKRLLYYCYSCGDEVEELHEGYCKPCLDQKQYELDTYNHNYHRWENLTYAQRNAEIDKAINLY